MQNVGMKNWAKWSVAAAAVFAGAGVVFAHDESGGKKAPPPDALAVTTLVRTGEGDHMYQNVPEWCKMPGGTVSLGASTHGGIVEDKAGNIYFSMDGGDVGIYVFKPDGTQLKTLGNKDMTGIHGMCINTEGDEQFIYASNVRTQKGIKMKLDGTVVWEIGFDKVNESGKYANAGQYHPTAIAVGPDGSVFICDGYGTSWIHKFDKDQKYVKSFGGKGTEPGKFQTCHGIGLDTRGEKPLLLICDRENRRIQHFDLDGNFVKVIAENLRRPCAPSFHGDHVAIAELEGRVTILDKDNKEIAHLGDNPDHGQWATNRVDPKDFKPGIFTSPHGVAFAHDGNIYVMDWNVSGRMSKFMPVEGEKKAQASAKAEKKVDVASR